VAQRCDSELLAGVSGLRRLSPAVCGKYARKLCGERHCRWPQACRRWTVNPSRKLRRFESFTCHHVRERASDLRKRGRRPFSYTWWGYRKLPCLGDLQCRGLRVCGLRKRVWRTAGVKLCTEYARKFQSRQRASRTRPSLTCADAEGGGMQWLRTYKLPRLSSFVANAFCGGRDQTRLQRRTVERQSVSDHVDRGATSTDRETHCRERAALVKNL
jgi:hypothetical protein